MPNWTEFYEPNGDNARNTALTHLEESLRKLAPDAAPYAAKLAHVRQIYYGLDRDDAFRLRLHRVLTKALMQASSNTSTARRSPGSFLTVVGNPGAGKSRMLEAALAQSGILNGVPFEDTTLRPAIAISAPSPFNRETFAEAILRALGMETDIRLQPNYAWRTIRNVLPRAGTSLIVIDEAQHIVRSDKPITTRQARDTLKLLVDDKDWPLSFVLVGTAPLERFVKTDNQISRRSTYMHLGSLPIDPRTNGLTGSDMQVMQETIDETMHRAGLSDGLDNRGDIVMRLAFACGLEYGRMFELVLLAAENALVSGAEALDRSHFEAALEERTMCAPDRNSFRSEVANYRMIRHWHADRGPEPAGENDILIPDRDPIRRDTGRAA